LRPERAFAQFVHRSLAAIGSDTPWLHEQLRRALGHWTALLVVDGECTTIRAGAANTVMVAAESRAADIRCTTTSAAILRLIQGADTIVDAIEADRVQLVGAADALLAWTDALDIFLHGAVRVRAFDGLLTDFEQSRRS